MIILSSLSSCSNAIREQESDSLNLIQNTSPFNLSASSSFYRNISYGNHERNLIDFFSPNSLAPTPLVIFIHGGGFTGGDKSIHYNEIGFQNFVNHLLHQKISVASINYRFIGAKDRKGVLNSLNDSKRALQFIRYYSGSFNIDKNKILLMGSSAGAGTSLWIGLSDDLAKNTSSDPILKESTRVNGIVALSTQSSYNVINWHNSTFKEYENLGMNFDAIKNLVTEKTILDFYGIIKLEDLDNLDIKDNINSLDMLSLLSNDDPEIYVENTDVEYKYPENGDDILHHPLHAKALLDNAEINNVTCKAYIPKMEIDNRNGEDMITFIIRILKE
ncbi:carboxylesterase family protein [Tenacibaculum sp. MEBiC06402]|uniref:carboxylesterase family protein n=1 Tax=unclassified Tenacibaculum TaxID=2635139 RepID=UPI003B9DBBC5